MSSPRGGPYISDRVELLTRPRPRVRSGCLTCRRRKVKCDEQRPHCHNCTRLRRACIYAGSSPSSRISPHACASEDGAAVAVTGAGESPPSTGLFPPPSPPPFALTGLETWTAPLDFFGPGTGSNRSNAFGMLENATDPLLSWSQSPLFGEAHLLPQSSVPPVLHDPAPFVYFLEQVDAPFIANVDGMNWRAMKRYMVGLAGHQPVVSQAIAAVELLYKAKANCDDTMNSMSSYYIAKSSYANILERDDSEPSIVLIVSFLLCCFEIVAQHETVPITLKPEGALVRKLEAWEHNSSFLWSPVLRRIRVWFQILHAKAMHLGGPGLLSPKVGRLLTSGQGQTPALAPIGNEGTPSPEEAILSDLAGALFEFYLEIQLVSTQIAGLNRHHRSRGFQTDEREVQHVAEDIERALHHLWQRRPALLRADRAQLQENLPPELKGRLGRLVDLCRTAYFAEIIYLGRAHGSSPTASAESLNAMGEIRSVVDACRGGESAVDPGFIWQLFLYAVEHPNPDESRWAAATLRRAQNPIWHSDFVCDLAEGISEEQRARAKRVDTRYFSLQHFSIPPPYI